MIDPQHMIKEKEKKCKDCDGSGKIELGSYDMFNVLAKPKTVIKKCNNCKGTGKAN